MYVKGIDNITTSLSHRVCTLRHAFENAFCLFSVMLDGVSLSSNSLVQILPNLLQTSVCALHTRCQRLLLTAERRHGGKAGLKQTQKVTIAMKHLGNASGCSAAQEAANNHGMITNNEGMVEQVVTMDGETRWRSVWSACR